MGAPDKVNYQDLVRNNVSEIFVNNKYHKPVTMFKNMIHFNFIIFIAGYYNFKCSIISC